MEHKESRYVNMTFGLWLVLSAFLWPHSAAQFANTWIMGLLTTAVALIGLWVPGVRFMNAMIGLWLLISAFGLPVMSRGTFWNNLLVGMAIVAVSLVGPRSSTKPVKPARSTV